MKCCIIKTSHAKRHDSDKTVSDETGAYHSELSEERLINAMVENPKLIERPIVIKRNQVIIGRPPENVLEIL